MNPILQALRSLQEVDREIFKVESELERLPQELASRAEGMAAQASALQDKRREVTELRTSIKEIEHTTVGLRQRLKKLEHESTSGTADASLVAAYSHEMRNIKRNISQAEDAGIKRLTRAEALDTEIEEMAGRLSEEEGHFETFKANVASEVEAAQKKLDELQTDRSQRSSDGIPPTDLDTYKGLLRTRQGEALAELRDGLCEGCFVNLPKNIVVRLARGMELVQCPSCDRILYSL